MPRNGSILGWWRVPSCPGNVAVDLGRTGAILDTSILRGRSPRTVGQGSLYDRGGKPVSALILNRWVPGSSPGVCRLFDDGDVGTTPTPSALGEVL
jgi:hypothetical protein